MKFHEDLIALQGKVSLHEARVNELLEGLAVARELYETIHRDVKLAEQEVESLKLHLRVEQMLLFQQKIEGRVMTASSQVERDAQFENYLQTLLRQNSEYGAAVTAFETLKNKEVNLSIQYKSFQDELSLVNGLTQLFAARLQALQPALEGEVWLMKQTFHNETKIKEFNENE